MTFFHADVNTSDLTSASTNILVTGGAGLVGNELLNQLLDKGYHVKATWHAGNRF